MPKKRQAKARFTRTSNQGRQVEARIEQARRRPRLFLPQGMPIDYLVPPTRGVVGFRAPLGQQVTSPPPEWERQHRAAEATIIRGRVQNEADLIDAPDCAPTRMLYPGRINNFPMGWTVDA